MAKKNNLFKNLTLKTIIAATVISPLASSLLTHQVLAETTENIDKLDKDAVIQNEVPSTDIKEEVTEEETETTVVPDFPVEEEATTPLQEENQAPIGGPPVKIEPEKTAENTYDQEANLQLVIDSLQNQPNLMFRSVSSQQQFINKIAGHAQQNAKKYNLYASVMIAQAIVESFWGGSKLSLAPHNNLFGIKGSYNGQSSYFWTKEWENGQYIDVYAAFRKYPSYLESLEDNAQLLRYGINGAPAFYNGTWIENTTSYRDATQWLQGRYATSPVYANTLNSIIATYNLTQYDNGTINHAVQSNVATDFGAKISPNAEIFHMSANGGLLTKVNGSVVSKVAPYNYRVTLGRKATTTTGQVYYLVLVNNVGYCWIEGKYLTISQTVTKTEKLNANAIITKNSSRFGMTNGKYIDPLQSNWSTLQYQKVKLTQAATTANGKKYYLAVNYKTGVGMAWIPAENVSLSETIVKTEKVNSNAMIHTNANRYGLYGKDMDIIRSNWSSFVNQKVKVSTIATSSSGKQFYLVNNYKTGVGMAWIPAENILLTETVVETKAMNEVGVITAAGNKYGLYDTSLDPLGSNWSSYVNQKVKIASVATTATGKKYYLLRNYSNNTGIAWIPAGNVAISDRVTSTKSIDTVALLKKNGNKYGLYGKDMDVLTGNWSAYLNKQVKVSSVAKTANGKEYYLVKDYNTNVGIAWIAADALELPEEIVKKETVNFEGIIKTDSARYGATSSHIDVINSTWTSMLGSRVKMTQMITTNKGNQYYLLINYTTNTGMAWIPVENVSVSYAVTGVSSVNLEGVITKDTKRYGLYDKSMDELPSTWTQFLNKKVKLSSVATTKDGQKFYLVKNYDTGVGMAWIPATNVSVK
ncbi:glucosaminidase domain-containing protein [Isobaculum melis]|uniref:Flagellum-specific peptidoglycan hydrolase FlgJ n=1 Tax=Isobaculum melis TaxID=142588 RepID=A0A1H9QPQ1_9LACT|nr:glucosaminidase domain-containing protein [Isobaculum melis]SER62424.1 Flagellum-specific peptidoglycan hydrolase FlgJ [Isobaculum melis]